MDLRQRLYSIDEKNYIIMGFVICTVHEILLVGSSRKEMNCGYVTLMNETRYTHYICVRFEVFTSNWT